MRIEPAIETVTRVKTFSSENRMPFDERVTCSIAEACDASGIGKTKLYELIQGGAIQTTRVGRRRLVRVPSLLSYLQTGAA